MTAFTGRVIVELLNIGEGVATTLTNTAVSLAAGAGIQEFFCAADGTPGPAMPATPCKNFTELFAAAGCRRLGGAGCIMNVTVVEKEGGGGGAPVARNVLPMALPSTFQLPEATVSFSVASAPEGSHEVELKLTATATALYVWLSTLEHGRFSQNAILMKPHEEYTVRFISFLEGGVSSAQLKKSLRVEHLGMYVH